MRTMYDAVTPANIPVKAQMVAGYVDGRYAWKAADWARFPHAVKVRIAVFSSTADGHVLDVEPGCSTPASAPGWVLRRRKAGVDPTVYCNTATWPVVRAAFKAAGVREPHWWIAAYPGNGPRLYPGSVAHQYANPGPVDISVVADYWPGVDPRPPTKPTKPLEKPVPPPPMPPVPPAPTGDEMLTKDSQAWIEARMDAHDAFLIQNLHATVTRELSVQIAELKASIDALVTGPPPAPAP